jgi:hypothetical protein
MNNRLYHKIRTAIAAHLILVVAITLANCGGYIPDLSPEDPFWRDNDTRHIPEPKAVDPSIAWDALRRSTFDQLRQILDLDRGLRDLTGDPYQSYNINSYDEVPNSAWWTNRHFFETLSPAELMRGSHINGGPDTTGPWFVFRPKVGGVTPGFWVKDRHGNAYILKFDPPGHPELGTSAASLAGRFFHACGYNVPEETITWFHPDSLIIEEDVFYEDDQGIKQPFTREVLNQILERVNIQPDGRVRCLASTLIPGKIKGPFSFSGRRRDDPNDWCPREYRRELRALKVFCAFVNHWDIKDANTIDSYIEDNGRQYIKHYLLDFGTCLGSGGHKPQNPKRGYTNFFDILDISVSYISLGLKVWPWEKAEDYEFPSVGYFESDLFEPDDWKPGYPLPAFENMTNRDAYWAAKIVMSFRDEHLQALVRAGRLSNPEAEKYLLETLKRRRDKIGRYYFSKVNPLDNFELVRDENGLTVSFEDLAVKYGLADSSQSSISVKYRGRTLIKNRILTTGSIVVNNDDIDKFTTAFRGGEKARDHLYQINIKSRRDGGISGKPVRVWLWYHPDKNYFQLVGIEHID